MRVGEEGFFLFGNKVLLFFSRVNSSELLRRESKRRMRTSIYALPLSDRFLVHRDGLKWLEIDFRSKCCASIFVVRF